MTATVVKCACPTCSCEASGSSAVFKNSQSFCSEACANGHPNNEPCHDADGACGCSCGLWPSTGPDNPSKQSTSTSRLTTLRTRRLVRSSALKGFPKQTRGIHNNWGSAVCIGEVHRDEVISIAIQPNASLVQVCP